MDPTSVDTALQATGVGWTVGGFTILDAVDLQVRRGELLCVIGPNGAGKSSLINILSGVSSPSAGEVYLAGRRITDLAPHQRIKAGLGRTFQTSSVFPRLTAHENVRLAAQASMGGSGSLVRRPRDGDRASVSAETWLNEVGLGRRTAEIAANLSHGDRRRLELAMVLCAEPRVVLLDEPTAGIAAEEVDALMDVIVAVNAGGATVVMVEHRIDVVASRSDRIAVMRAGTVLMIGAPAEVLRDPTVQQAYLGEETTQ